ncbi:bifunctional GNAT family N-acetyltransferase/(deoxy)nucleoside triphosphate pyrophosphohydrolase [Roseococcus sp. DSY-14]|uniref:bifunctional GNAT family N-acetyltransferase/(deoxy)nucleoside triphosphate pyrophosphohydrolase n=1 Tax=Roseococcus sp. DSY-14 TaxID=3369650 RepID=UPI00387B8458
MAATAAELPIRTERLELRPLRRADAAAMTRLVNDYSVAGNLARVPFPYREELAEEWIAATHRQHEAGDAWHLAITLDGALVGCVGLTRKAGAAPELGYWVGRRFWGQGIAREAAGALLDWAARAHGHAAFRASALTDNAASRRVLEALGFREHGQGQEPFLSRNRAMPVTYYERAAAPAPAAKPLLLVVACALVDVEGRVLLARRPPGKPMAGLWEFPGGKLHEGETPEAALIRELREELGIGTWHSCLAPLVFASHAYERFHLLMPLFACRKWEGRPTPREGQELAWVAPERLGDYPMPPADIPLIPLLRDFL